MTRARILSKLGSSPAVFSDGAVVAGITTIDASGVNITGVATATSTIIAGITTIDASGVNITGVVTATSFSGDGSSLSGVGVPGVSTTGHSIFNTINASGIVTASNISIPDNGKFTCGAGDDLELYHNGSDSYIRDVGTGDLIIQANSLQMSNTSGTNYLHGTASAEVSLYHNGNVKLATNSGGVTVTGTVTTDQVTSGISTFTGAISANAGIDFSGAQTNAAGMTSETLDSYEEGSFTPVLSYTSGASGVTYSVQKGRYTKIGNVCFFQLQVNLTDKGTSSGGSVQFSGLPFTPAANGGSYNVNNPMVNFVAHGGLNASDDGLVPFCQVESSNLVTYWHDTGGSGSWNYLYHSHIEDGSIFVVHGSFTV
jgi:hypothetical protein